MGFDNERPTDGRIEGLPDGMRGPSRGVQGGQELEPKICTEIQHAPITLSLKTTRGGRIQDASRPPPAPMIWPVVSSRAVLMHCVVRLLAFLIFRVVRLLAFWNYLSVRLLAYQFVVWHVC